MNQKNGKASRFSLNEDGEWTQKRQKLNPPDSSLPPSGENPGGINEICQEISDRLEGVKNIVESQAAVDKQTIRDLQSSLEEARASAREFLEGQVEISKKNAEMRRRNIELWNRNTELADNLTSVTNEAAQEKLKRDAAEKNVELQKIELREVKEKLDVVTSQRTYLWGEIQELLKKAARADQLEKDLKSLRETVASQEKNSRYLEQLVPPPEGANAEVTLKVQEFVPMNCRVTRATLKKNHHLQEDEPLGSLQEVLKIREGGLGDVYADRRQRAMNNSRNHRESSSGKGETSAGSDGVVESAAKMKKGGQEVRFMMREHYGLVSDHKYFEIDWNEEYESLGGDRARCKRCSYIGRSGYIKDHVWSKHYGGKFRCAYCPNRGVEYAGRNSLGNHIRQNHSDVLQLKA